MYGQQDIVDTVKKFVHQGRLPHLLFYGPPGTGKTSTIIALAREIYGPNYRNMVLELNALDDRGIDVVRNRIKDFASTRQIFSKGFKLVILDEADAMTAVAQNSLRRIIEQFTKNTRFCILANYAHKLNPALLLRCTRFRFLPILPDLIKNNLKRVIREENVDITAGAETALLRLSRGDMRRALNVLQLCKAATVGEASEEIGEDMIYESIGAPRPEAVEAVLDAILVRDWTSAVSTMDEYMRSQGMALVDMIEGMVGVLKGYEMKAEARTRVLAGLSDVEHAISRGGNQRIHCSGAIAVIKDAMEIEGGEWRRGVGEGERV